MGTIRGIWGEVAISRDGRVELASPEGPADGIGSALALMEWDGEPVTLRVCHRERRGGVESWRGFWLLFPRDEGNVHPCLYVRPLPGGWEWGRVQGGEPEDQDIDGTVVGGACAEPEDSMAIVARWRHGALHVGRPGAPTISLTLPLAPAALGLYCEASRVEVEICGP